MRRREHGLTPLPTQWREAYRQTLDLIHATPCLSVRGLEDESCVIKRHLQNSIRSRQQLLAGQPVAFVQVLYAEELEALIYNLEKIRGIMAELIELQRKSGSRNLEYQVKVRRIVEVRGIIWRVWLGLAPAEIEWFDKMRKGLRKRPIDNAACLKKIKTAIWDLWLILGDVPQLPPL